MNPPTAKVILGSAPEAAILRPVSLADLGQSIHNAKREGAYADGVQAGIAQAHEQAAKALTDAVERLDQAREQALDLLSTQVVELSVEIARQLLQVEIAAENYDLERIIRMSLAHSGLGRGAAVVHVNPEDHQRLADIEFRAGTELCPDSKLNPGDVQVESPRGLLVREVDASLANIREHLLEDVV